MNGIRTRALHCQCLVVIPRNPTYLIVSQRNFPSTELAQQCVGGPFSAVSASPHEDIHAIADRVEELCLGSR